MSQIRIDTEYAREVGRRLIAEGNRLAEMGRELEHAIGSLDTWAWDGASRWRAEPLLSRVRPESTSVAEGLATLGRKLMRVADVFEQEDGTAAQNLAGMPWVDFETTDKVGDLLHKISDGAELIQDVEDFIDYSLGIAASVVIASALVKGTTYSRQVIFYGSRTLKEWAGVSPFLTHIKDVHIPVHMAKQALQVTKRGVLLEALSEMGENWEEYGGDIPKVATGVVVDTAIGVGFGVAGAAVGTLVFGAVGGALLGPPGALIGGKIGGIVGSMAGGWVTEKAENIKVGDRELDQAIVEESTGLIRAGAQKVDRALGSFVNGVARLF